VDDGRLIFEDDRSKTLAEAMADWVVAPQGFGR
jgi:hypothetical protein